MVVFQVNVASVRSEPFRRRQSQLRFALQLRAQPLCFYPVVVGVKSSRLLLLLPKHLPLALRVIDVDVRHLVFPGASVKKMNTLHIQCRLNVSLYSHHPN